MSAVSVHRALHSLEEAMRCTLFRHEGRNLNATDAAHVLAQVARDVLKAMDDGIRATRQAAGYSAPRIRIGSLYSLTTKTAPEVIIALKVRRPELEAELLLGSNADLLARAVTAGSARGEWLPAAPGCDCSHPGRGRRRCNAPAP